MLVYRGTGSEVVVELRSDEELGLLDTGYLQDYYGTDGQISLHHLETGTRYALLMAEQPQVTPDVPKDAFIGVMDMTTLPDGEYQVEGLVRDVRGVPTVLSAHSNPPVGAKVTLHEFSLIEGVPFPPIQAHFLKPWGQALQVVEATPVYLEVWGARDYVTDVASVYLTVIEHMFIRPYGGVEA